MNTLRWALLEAAQQGYQKGLFSGTSGNLSMKVGENQILITPTSVRYETMTPEQLVLMDLEGKAQEGTPSSEWRLHAALYRRFPEIQAVVHTHSVYATAFAAARKEIPLALIEMQYFLGGSVPCADYAVPGTEAVGESCARVLPGHGGCLMANHGAVAIGRSLSEAFLRAEYIEDAARITLLATQLGGVYPLTQEDF